MTFYKESIDGATLNFDDLGFRTVDFVVDSPSFSHKEKEINSIVGVVPTESTRQPREINVTFRFVADDWIDFAMMRQLFFDTISSGPIFLIEARKQGEMWECRLNDSFKIPQINTSSTFTVSFICYPGKSISVGTTAENITFNKLSYYNLPTTIDDYKEVEKVVFRIFNPGLEIDPRDRNSHLKITYEGVSSDFGITNLTTGEKYLYEGVTTEDDKLVIDGINSFKNGESVFLNTNKKLITLARGWNKIVLHGVPDAVNIDDLEEFEDVKGLYPVTFDFRFNFN